MNRFTHVASAMLALLSLSLPTLAGDPTAPISHGREVAPWPSSGLGVSDSFEAIAIADLDGDQVPDAVVRSGDGLVFLPRVDDYTAPMALLDSSGAPFVAHDVALIAKPASIAIVGPDGLRILEWSSAAEYFVEQSLEAGDWLGAHSVEVVDYNGDGIEDLIGLDATRQAVLVRLGKAGGGWVGSAPMPLLLPATELVPVQWFADAPLEFAVIDGIGLQVFNHKGGLEYVRGSILPTAGLARIEDGSGFDSLAWLVGPTSSGDSYLTTLGSSGVRGTVLLPGLTGLEMGAGDLDGDGDFDVALTVASRPDVLLLQNDGGTFVWGSEQWLDGGSAVLEGVATKSTAKPVIADTDGDGVLEVVHASQTLQGVALYHDLPVTTWVSSFAGSATAPGFLEFVPPSFCNNAVDNGILSVAFEYDTQAPEYEVTLWYQESQITDVTPTALSRCFMSRNSSSTTQYAQLVITPTPGQAWNLNNGIFHVMVQPVDAAHQVSGPPIFGAFAPVSDSLDLADAVEGWTAIVLVDVESDCSSASLMGGGATGGWSGRRRIPPTPPNARPDKNVACKGENDTTPPAGI